LFFKDSLGPSFEEEEDGVSSVESFSLSSVAVEKVALEALRMLLLERAEVIVDHRGMEAVVVERRRVSPIKLFEMPPSPREGLKRPVLVSRRRRAVVDMVRWDVPVGGEASRVGVEIMRNS
jgi:hypothetical protein